MDAEDRFRVALMGLVHREFLEDGLIRASARDVRRIAQEEHVPDHVVDHVLAGWEERGWLRRVNAVSFEGHIELAWEYERSEAGRVAGYTANRLRRQVLEAAVGAFEAGKPELEYHGDGERFIDRPFRDVDAAVRMLEHLRLVSRRAFLGPNLAIEIAPRGYDTWREPLELSRLLPLTPSEDVEAGRMSVVPDVLSQIIRTCDDLLRRLGWDSASSELREGDRQYQAREWVNAVREYYSALESGLRYCLVAAGSPPADGSSLRTLTKAAARVGVIPDNYQALFGYTDSIRSPRSPTSPAQRVGAPPMKARPNLSFRF